MLHEEELGKLLAKNIARTCTIKVELNMEGGKHDCFSLFLKYKLF